MAELSEEEARHDESAPRDGRRFRDGAELQQLADELARTFPSTTREFPFGPDAAVHRVRGKMFLMLTAIPVTSTGYGVREVDLGQQVLVLKADPVDAASLRAQFPDITPGYHLNKRHWVTVAPGPSIDHALVQELVIDAYRTVVAGLPRAARPVDPTLFEGPRA